jgi:hypothetical protein
MNTGEVFSEICLPVIARSYFLHLVRSVPPFFFPNCGQKGILALRNATSTSYFSSSLSL